MNKLNINQWAEEDRPREKMMQKGAEALTDAELLAILIGSGNTEESAVSLGFQDTLSNLIGGLKMYDVIVSMSGGGPNRGSLSLSYYIQLLYFNDERAGYAASVGLITFLIILCITLPVNWYLRKREVQY